MNRKAGVAQVEKELHSKVVAVTPILQGFNHGQTGRRIVKGSRQDLHWLTSLLPFGLGAVWVGTDVFFFALGQWRDAAQLMTSDVVPRDGLVVQEVGQLLGVLFWNAVEHSRRIFEKVLSHDFWQVVGPL